MHEDIPFLVCQAVKPEKAPDSFCNFISLEYNIKSAADTMYFRKTKSPPPFKRVVCTRAISPPLLGQRLKALAFSFSYGNPAYAVFPQLRSSHIALDSSLPLKGHCYYLALTLKRVFIFFYT